MKFRVNDLVRHKRSERGMIGLIVGFSKRSKPIVLWDDGRCSWCVPYHLKVIQNG